MWEVLKYTVVALCVVQYGKYNFEFLIFCTLIREPLGDWNNTKIWETKKIFANMAQTTIAITTL